MTLCMINTATGKGICYLYTIYSIMFSIHMFLNQVHASCRLTWHALATCTIESCWSWSNIIIAIVIVCGKEETRAPNADTTEINAWQEAVLSCQNASQLVVCMNLLDTKIIAWEKSTTKVFCSEHHEVTMILLIYMIRDGSVYFFSPLFLFNNLFFQTY